jgi:hypothetical protein
MENTGKLLEAWVCTCGKCGEEKFLNWSTGVDMSKSQAKHLLKSEDNQWIETDRYGWICADCAEEES